MAETDMVLLGKYAASRDAEAFAELVRRYAGVVYGTCLRVLRSEADAEDVTQDCFLELARRAGKVRGAGDSVAGFIHALARSRAVDFMKQASRRRKRERLAGGKDRAGGRWAEIEPLVDAAMAELPEDQRELLVVHFLRGATQAELAQAVGMDQSTISRRLARAVELLREQLAKQGVEVSAGALGAVMAEQIVRDVPAGVQASLAKMAMAGLGKAAGVGIAAKVAIAAMVAAAAVGATVAQRGPTTQATPAGVPAPATTQAVTRPDDVQGAPTAAELIQQLQQAELWVNEVKSFDLEMEVQWSKDEGAGMKPQPAGHARVAFDDRRAYHCRENVEQRGMFDLCVWDGKVCTGRLILPDDLGVCDYELRPQNAMGDTFRYVEWLRCASHPFWFLSREHQVIDPLGLPEDWQLRGTRDFRGTRCYVVEKSRGYECERVYVGVADRRLYGRGSYRLADEDVLLDELRNQAAADGKVLDDPQEIYRWLRALPKERSRKVLHEIAPRLGEVVTVDERWMGDYREAGRGRWVPMTSGFIYGGDPSATFGERGTAKRSQCDIRVTRLVIDEPLNDALFAPDFRLAEGVLIRDRTRNPPCEYRYKANRTAEEWKRIEEEARLRTTAR